MSAHPATLVLFGATGDLAQRKLLPALLHLRVHGMLAPETAIVATAPDDLRPAGFAGLARAAIRRHSPLAGHPAEERLLEQLTYVRSAPDSHGLGDLARAVERAEAGGLHRRVHYLAVPPHAFAGLTEGLVASDLADGARIVYEKPFGEDHAAFRHLRALVRTRLEEDQVLCVDHFLAKEAVRQLLRARIGDHRLADVWNREHIARVAIDAPEIVGIGQRGAFYERTGALKDMVMTHLLQLLAVVAMDRPASGHPAEVDRARTAALDAVAPLDPREIVRGQYDGYRDVAHVHPASDTETFLAARVMVGTDTWRGVPFLLRTGKRLASDRQCIDIAFRHPVPVFAGTDGRAHRHVRSLRFDLRMARPVPGTTRLAVAGSATEPAALGAYEHLLDDVLRGGRESALSGAAIARTWEIAADALESPPPLHLYAPGSGGPPAAARLLVAPTRARTRVRSQRGCTGAGAGGVRRPAATGARRLQRTRGG